MRTTSALLLLLALAACGSTDAGTEAPDTSTTGGSTDASTDASTAAATTHASHASHTTGDPSTGHEHSTGDTSTGHEHTTDSPTSTGTTAGDDSPAADYCECMVVNCHDQYHDAWGEEHPMSEVNCMNAAAMVPSVGTPAMSGNSIECRLFHCAGAIRDESLCDAAIGGAPCN